MKINDIISLSEAKFDKPTIMYHGTSAKNVKTILSQGLTTNNSDGYGSGIGGKSNQRDMTAIGGVYLTTSLRMAQSAASSLGSGNILFITCSIQAKSAYADEDDIDGLLKRAINTSRPKDVLTMFAGSKYLGTDYTTMVLEALPKEIQSLIEHQPKGIQLLTKFIESYLARSLSHSIHDGNQFSTSPKFILADIMNIKDSEAIDHAFDKLVKDVSDVEQAETNYRKYLERFTVILKRHSYDSDVNSEALNTRILGSSLRMPNSISYKGNNRIINIIEVDSENKAFIIHYDKGSVQNTLEDLSKLYGDYSVEDSLT